MGAVGYKKPPKEHQFKKGNSGNPQGGKLHNPILRKIKRLTTIEIAEIGSLVLSQNTEALMKLIKDSKDNPNCKESALKIWMASVAMKAIAKGDAHSMDVLLNRLVGKAPEKIELTGKDGGAIRSVVGDMTPEERAAEIVRLKKIREQSKGD